MTVLREPDELLELLGDPRTVLDLAEKVEDSAQAVESALRRLHRRGLVRNCWRGDPPIRVWVRTP